MAFDFDFSNPSAFSLTDFTPNGDAEFHGSLFDLTANTYSGGINNSVGSVAYAHPVPLRDNTTGQVASFTTTFSFGIKITDGNNKGDGVAFFLGKYPPALPPNSQGGALGLCTDYCDVNKTAGDDRFVAVEFDTFNDRSDPNVTYDHMGIDVNSMVSVANLSLLSFSLNRTMSARVDYNGSAGVMNVEIQSYSSIRRTRSSMELRRPTTLAPRWTSAPCCQQRWPCIEFSAATGASIELHQLHSWSFSLLPPGSSSSTASSMDEDFEKGSGPKRFDYAQLSAATGDFCEEEKLGEGGFGAVYRGYLKEQDVQVAIKRVSRGSIQGRKEYTSEVKIISRLRHGNLVQLIGWCHEGRELLLVYELMPNGTLDTHLYNPTVLLTWPARFKIVLGLGSALLYLHQEWEQCVVHRDIKPSNIMLDASFVAKLGDFGLARLFDHGRGSHTTNFAGTMGYMDPECFLSGRAGPESDVYSFGVGRARLVEWVWGLYGSGAVLEAADERMGGDFDRSEMERVMVVGLACAHPDGNLRPSIRQAVSMLQCEVTLPKLSATMPTPKYS
ncbi:hypothetical protein BS78_02G154100 [Paspalum vaginatum]|nr:hypothetical protein BS78_02G154100 [Paspalum vaginatum]